MVQKLPSITVGSFMLLCLLQTRKKMSTEIMLRHNRSHGCHYGTPKSMESCMAEETPFGTVYIFEKNPESEK